MLRYSMAAFAFLASFTFVDMARSEECSIFKHIPVVDRSTSNNRFLYLSSFLSWMEQYSSYDEAKNSSVGLSSAFDSTLQSFGFSKDDEGFSSLKENLKTYTGSQTFLNQDVDLINEKINDRALQVLDNCLSRTGIFAWLEVEDKFEDTFTVAIQYRSPGEPPTVSVDELLLPDQIECKGKLADPGIFTSKAEISSGNTLRALCIRGNNKPVRIVINASQNVIGGGELVLPSLENRGQIVDDTVPIKPTVELYASRSVVEKGGEVALNWVTENASIQRIDNEIGAVTSSGQRVVNVGEKDITFTLTAENAGLTSKVSQEIKVVPWIEVLYIDGSSKEWSRGEDIQQNNWSGRLRQWVTHIQVNSAQPVAFLIVGPDRDVAGSFKGCYLIISSPGKYEFETVDRKESTVRRLMSQFNMTAKNAAPLASPGFVPADADCVASLP